MKVPFLDLKRQYEMLKPELDQVVAEIMTEQWFIGGPRVAAFESAFAEAHAVSQGVGVGNATDGLFILLKALDIGPGDEVIVPAHGWLSAAEMVVLAGATPVFADVDPHSFCIDPTRVVEKIGPKTKAIIPIHLYGQMANMAALNELASEHKLYLIEDCAQAHFASQAGRAAGSQGIAGVFSYYPSKLLGAFGDGGCITTHDEALAENCRALANHGGRAKNDHFVPGLNSRLDSLQAAVLHTKLQHVYDWITGRNHVAGFYSSALAGIEEVVTPRICEGNSHNFHLYVIRAQKRDELKAYLKGCGIETEVHYPLATPFTPAFSKDFSESEFPVSVQLQGEVLSLPIFATITHPEVEHVASCIQKFYGA